ALRLVRYPEKLILVVHALLAVGVARGLESVMRRPTRLRLTAAVAAVLSASSLVASWAVVHSISPVPEVLSRDLLFIGMSSALLAGILAVGGRQPTLCAAALV